MTPHTDTLLSVSAQTGAVTGQWFELWPLEHRTHVPIQINITAGTATVTIEGRNGTEDAAIVFASVTASDNLSIQRPKHIRVKVTSATGATIRVTMDKPAKTTLGVISAEISTLTPTAASIAADGVTTQVLTVTAYDRNGNRLTAGGSTVAITQSSGTGTIGAVTDVGDGTYTATVTSAASAGSGVFVATINGVSVKSGTSSQTQSTITYT